MDLPREDFIFGELFTTYHRVNSVVWSRVHFTVFVNSKFQASRRQENSSCNKHNIWKFFEAFSNFELTEIKIWFSFPTNYLASRQLYSCNMLYAEAGNVCIHLPNLLEETHDVGWHQLDKVDVHKHCLLLRRAERKDRAAARLDNSCENWTKWRATTCWWVVDDVFLFLSILNWKTIRKISKYHVCCVWTIFLTSTGLKLRVEKYREMRSGQLISRRERYLLYDR